MRTADLLHLASGALLRRGVRAGMLLLAMAIGVAAVIVLTGLGEGARRYVTAEFSSLGTHLLIVLPGRSETTGAGAALLVGETPRDLTLNDARALSRSHAIEKIAPLVVGSASVSYLGLDREVPVLGSTTELLEVRNWEMAQGRFLPAGDMDRAQSVAVIGAKIKRELFGNSNALGKWLRLGDRRFRVIGVLSSEGRAIGIDVEELVIVPVASAQMLFNSASLFRILVQARSRDEMQKAKKFILKTVADRHQGEEDITVITQDAVLKTFDSIFVALTMTLGGIAAVSLLVAGILVMNVMLVAVSQRTEEIGLLKAIGAQSAQVRRLFLAEALLLSLTGGILGLALGYGAAWLLGVIYPTLSFIPPLWAVIAAMVTAIFSGLFFGMLPARRAAKMDPVQALSGG
ncbi:MAG: ABC transporter permease [Gammaproteobacteria bacterium]|nr:ABC transporter permease [Gammaproteobacteria bacterium]